MSDFVLILSLLFCWLFDDSAFVLGHASEKEKNNSGSWFYGKLSFFDKSKFLPLLWKFFIDEKWYSSHRFSEDLGYEIFKKKLKRKLKLAKWRKKHGLFVFFQCLLNFRDHALQSELNKVSVSNFVKFRLQSISFKIEREFEKTNKIFHPNRAKKDI